MLLRYITINLNPDLKFLKLQYAIEDRLWKLDKEINNLSGSRLALNPIII